MTPERAVAQFLAQWAEATQRRDPDKVSDLFLRDPAPLVTFSDGERARDWLDVRVRLGRDFERAILERVEVHESRCADLTPDVVACSFEYDMTLRDPWGVVSQVTRAASMTLLRTKDGFRIASAHFSVPR